jgi:hypothetical protein
VDGHGFSGSVADAAHQWVPICGCISCPYLCSDPHLTRPDYGAEFWRTFRHEIYLSPVYVSRGLLVWFFLLLLLLFARARWKDMDQARTFLLCLIIGFALTSWEALITPAPPHSFEGGGLFVGPWKEVVWDGWFEIIMYIEQYIPPDYRNAARVGASVYPFLAFFLLLFPGYRRFPKDFIMEYRGEFPTFLFIGVLLGLSGWAFSAAQGSGLGGGTKFLLGVLSIPAVCSVDRYCPHQYYLGARCAFPSPGVPLLDSFSAV